MKVLNRIGKFITTIFIGGIGVIFPIATLFFFFSWLIRVISIAIGPVAKEMTLFLGVSTTMSTVLLIVLIFLSCFAVGLIVRTRTGTFVHNKLEKHLLSRLPGYRLIREAIRPLFTPNRTVSLSRPVLVRPYNNETLMTAFITDTTEDGSIYTVFVPTSPNPTSGLVFHVREDQIQYLDSGFEETMRTVIAGGSGSKELFRKIRKHGQS